MYICMCTYAVTQTSVHMFSEQHHCPLFVLQKTIVQGSEYRTIITEVISNGINTFFCIIVVNVNLNK